LNRTWLACSFVLFSVYCFNTHSRPSIKRF
jgi:hypothetical protein